MTEAEQPNGTQPEDPLKGLRKRLRDLNVKAYYLLIALSFLYFHGNITGIKVPRVPLSLKWALTLTGLVAVLPLQDFFEESLCWLQFIRWFKVSALGAALLCTLWWVWLYKP